MTSDSPGMTVKVVRAERSRFRHPLLLLHGLWTGSWIWRDFAPYLGHRGWDSWAPSFLDDDAALDFESRRRIVLSARADMASAPVVIGHDVGGMLALAVARELAAPAVVVIAPPTASMLGRRGPWASPRFWGARLMMPRLPLPRGRTAETLLAGLANDDRGRLHPDSGSFFRALSSGGLGPPEPPASLGLVIASSGDPAAPRPTCERLASEHGWPVVTHDAPGHFPMLGAVTSSFADLVHRRLVQALGADLLAWLDEEEGDG